VAFLGVPPPGNFNSVALNISGVRINKAVDATVNSPGWVTIAVPTGVGSGNQANPGDLQIDLVKAQTGAVMFNVGGVPVGTYNTVQVLVDPSIPGNIIPACQSASSNTEGCINYPIHFDINNPTLDNVIFTLGTPVNATANATAPLLIQLGVSIVTPPINTGDPYLADITGSEVNFGSFLGAINGSVTTKGSSTGTHITPLTVAAELSGTNDIIETVPVKSKGAYTLELPAAPNGTAYDIFTLGGGDTYASMQNLALTPGQSLTEDLKVTGTTTTVFEGTIADACKGVGIPGAQLELLAPAANATELPVPRPTPSATGYCLSNPQQCVVVASATADQSGDYPLPGTALNPALFAQVPTNLADLAVRVSASGYSTLMSSAFLRGTNNQICSASSANPSTICNFSLTTGYINGTVNLVSDPPPGNSVLVEVFAENSGTNEIVSALTAPLKFIHQQTSQPFTLNVPVTGAGPNFDLFAVAIDPYLGATAPFPGHEFSVLANVPGPAGNCDSIPPIPPSPAPSPTPIAMPAMDCVGHGSITGTVQNPDNGTYVEVEKQGVQILGTALGLFSSNLPSNTQYSLCVPPDDYTLQRFEVAPTPVGEPTVSGTDVATPVPTAIPGATQTVTVPQPAATSSPCPSSCSNNSDSDSGPCPGICIGTLASPL
jgi:hypothetical protein